MFFIIEILSIHILVGDITCRHHFYNSIFILILLLDIAIKLDGSKQVSSPHSGPGSRDEDTNGGGHGTESLPRIRLKNRSGRRSDEYSSEADEDGRQMEGVRPPQGRIQTADGKNF